MSTKNLYTLLADLLVYPKEDIGPRIKECLAALDGAGYPPEAAAELKKFQHEVDSLSLDDIQGIYSYTFEMTSDYTLDIGSLLYDGFKRSSKLSALKSMYMDTGFPYDEVAKGELPDHLPVLLRFLGYSQDAALKHDLVETFINLAMEKLSKNFHRNKGNLYAHLIDAIYRVIDKDVKEAK